MKRRNRIPAAAAACLLLFSAAGCGNRQDNSYAELSADDLIEQIITYHGCYGKEADGKVQTLLSALGSRDRRQGRLWQDIMDYWDDADADMQINLDRLPDGLPEDDSLALAVLGYQLNEDGSMQEELLERLAVALHCAEQYPEAYVICTGGGTAARNPAATEGSVMGEWLTAHGLDKKRLIIEDQSRTTAENALNSYSILLKDYPQIRSVAIISSSYHIAWGSLMFEAAFLKYASEHQTAELHVVSNCACDIPLSGWQGNLLRWQTGGMFQLIGKDELASQFYYNLMQRPPLS